MKNKNELLIVSCYDLSYGKSCTYNNKLFTGLRSWKKGYIPYGLNFYAEYYKDGKFIFSSNVKNIFSLEKLKKYIELMIFE